MSTTSKVGPAPFTHVAYFFIKTAMRKGIVYGYWKDGGRGRPQSDGNFIAKIDMLPQGGWDGRIAYVKIGDPPPSDQVPAEPRRPGEDADDAED